VLLHLLDRVEALEAAQLRRREVPDD
jgi:hypothetical protein